MCVFLCVITNNRVKLFFIFPSRINKVCLNLKVAANVASDTDYGQKIDLKKEQQAGEENLV